MEEREVKENTLYRHFKGDIIKVIHIAYDTETLKKLVVYEHNDKIWVSIVDNNVWEPGVYGWEEVIEEE